MPFRGVHSFFWMAFILGIQRNFVFYRFDLKMLFMAFLI